MELPSEAGIVATARGFLVVLALSIHDLFEGVALGVARSGGGKELTTRGLGVMWE